MHALDRKKAIEISKLRNEKGEAESQIYTFQPKINKRRQEMYLPKIINVQEDCVKRKDD